MMNSSSSLYVLPGRVSELVFSLVPGRSRAKASQLVEFLGRFHALPEKLLVNSSFAVDRRALAGRDDLGLSEDQIRSALKVLEKCGLLDRVPVFGSAYRVSPCGTLMRKAVQYRFGPELRAVFLKVCFKAVNAARRLRSRIVAAPARAPGVVSPSVALELPKFEVPQIEPSATKIDTGGLVGHEVLSPPSPGLEAAIARLLQVGRLRR